MSLERMTQMRGRIVALEEEVAECQDMVPSGNALVAWLFSQAHFTDSRESGPGTPTCSLMLGAVPKTPPKQSTFPFAGGAKPLRHAPETLGSAIKRFGVSAKAKLSNAAAKGQPEDQLRAPLERLVSDLAGLRVPGAVVSAVGESSLKEIKTRPDYAVTVSNALVGFIEVKAPGKGADPRSYKGHDKEQWNRLQSLPNLVYTDGNAFSLWRNGELVLPIVRLVGDVETSGPDLDAPDSLLSLIESFLRWEPIAPRNAKQLADTSARLCRLLREEVAEQLALKNPALTSLAKDWRRVLFPNASDVEFADGYAQAVTFGMLMAKARGVKLAHGLTQAAQKLGHTLIGAALRVLTFSAETARLTSIGTLVRVLDEVDWAKIEKEKSDAWLYFYEDFLTVYDNELRKRTGSYYTPVQVVTEMVRLVDEVLRTRFDQAEGLASTAVTLADPAVGTGTFLLGVLRKIATTMTINRRSVLLGSVSAAVLATTGDPLTVAELRLLAIAAAPATSSVEKYNRDRIIKNGTLEKKIVNSLVAKGFFVKTENDNPNANCGYFVEPTEKGLVALRAAGVSV